MTLYLEIRQLEREHELLEMAVSFLQRYTLQHSKGSNKTLLKEFFQQNPLFRFSFCFHSLKSSKEKTRKEVLVPSFEANLETIRERYQQNPLLQRMRGGERLEKIAEEIADQRRYWDRFSRKEKKAYDTLVKDLAEIVEG